MNSGQQLGGTMRTEGAPVETLTQAYGRRLSRLGEIKLSVRSLESHIIRGNKTAQEEAVPAPAPDHIQWIGEAMDSELSIIEVTLERILKVL